MSEVLIAEDLEGREGDEGLGNRCSVLKFGLDLVLDNDERSEDCGDAGMIPLAWPSSIV